MSSDEGVEGVDERRQSQRAQHSSEPPRQPDLGQEDDTPARFAGDGHRVAADDPPALGASVLRHRGKQVTGRLVRKW